MKAVDDEYIKQNKQMYNTMSKIVNPQSTFVKSERPKTQDS